MRRPKRRIVYSADTIPTNNLIEYSRNADLLIMDCFTTSHNIEIARRLFHSTALEAGEVAMAAKAKKLSLKLYSRKG